MDIVVKDGTNT